jgi:hypothetical protein
MIKNKLLLVFFLVSVSFSQSISGTVVDSETKEALIGANVYLEGTVIGAMTDVDGKFHLKAKSKSVTLVIDYIGYKKYSKKFDLAKDINRIFELKEDIFSQEVTVIAQRAKPRETPVAVTTIDVEEIETKIAGRDITSVVTAVPGAHITDQGGASGDSRISLRGFAQENIAVMINGVPVNDMENRHVYWSNWSALSDITKSVQTQRGLGASSLSTSAVGGILNMMVKASDADMGFKYRQDIGSDGLFKESFVANSGLINNSFAVSAMIGKKDFAGYADMTASDEWLWFVGASAFINKHSFHFSAYGTPQERERRSYKKKIDVWETYGKNYNPNVAYTDSLKKNLVNTAGNKYHKPTVNLNHIWDITPYLTMENVAYASWGRGYGQSLWGNRRYNKPDSETGWYNFYDLKKDNEEETGATTNPVLVNAHNEHNWYGFASTINWKKENNSFVFGVDGRTYQGLHYRTIEDMFGSKGFNEVEKTRSGLANPNAQKGDIVFYNYNGYVNQLGFFIQDEYKFLKDFHLFANMSLAFVEYDYEDIYHEVSRANTPNVSFKPLTVKAGINYNIDAENNVYINIGRLQQAPFHRNVYGNNTYTNLNSNYFVDLDNPKEFASDKNDNKIDVDPSDRSVAIANDVIEETVYSMEFGYGYSSNWLAINANAYYTRWKDKSIIVNTLDIDEQQISFSLSGLHAVHKGLELEGKLKPTDNLELRSSVSLQNNTWRNSVGYESTDENGKSDKGIFFLKGLKVGGSPQQTYLGAIKYKFKFNSKLNGFVDLEMKNNREYYGYFSPDELTYLGKDGNTYQSPSIPIYTESNLTGKIYYKPNSNGFIKRVSLTGNIFNLLNEDYISDGAIRGSKDNYQVFYARPRYYSLSVSIEF